MSKFPAPAVGKRPEAAGGRGPEESEEAPGKAGGEERGLSARGVTPESGGRGPESSGREPEADSEEPELAARIIGALTRRNLTVATAESLTGGLVCAALTAVPGASAVLRGGVVAYATDLKAALLGVPAPLLAASGAVDPGVAAEMADGVRKRLGAAVGAATTGVAGPDPAEGKPPGTVHIAVSTGGGRITRTLALAGSRDQIRDHTVRCCLSLLWAVLTEEDD